MANVAPRTNRRFSVGYRDLSGRVRTAKVLGAGSVSGLKLHVQNGPNLVVIDDVALATTQKQTNVYFNQR